MMKELLITLVIIYVVYCIYYVAVMLKVFKRMIPLQMIVQNYAQVVELAKQNIGIEVCLVDDKQGKVIFRATSAEEYRQNLENLISDDIFRVTRFPFLIKHNRLMNNLYEDRVCALQYVRQLSEMLKQEQSV